MNAIWNYACAVLACLVCTTANSQSAASDFPTKPVQVVVPYAAGGPSDVLARILGGKLSERAGQPVIVVNKPGAGAIIGTEAVVRATPDGYTLLFQTGAISIDPSMRKNPSYDVRKDLAPITLAVAGHQLLVINPAVPAKTVGELIAYAKSRPGKLNIGSPGKGTSIHLAGELFKAMAGIEMVHVPYKGSAAALNGLIGNEIQVLFDPIITSRPQIDAGRIRLLAVGSQRRSSLLPDVPTVAESGVPGFEAAVWFGFFAPAGTPREVVTKLNKELREVLQNPDVKARISNQGLEVVGNSPDEFARLISAEVDRWAKVIRDARIEPQ